METVRRRNLDCLKCGYAGDPIVAGEGMGSHWYACPQCGAQEGAEPKYSLATWRQKLEMWRKFGSPPDWDLRPTADAFAAALRVVAAHRELEVLLDREQETTEEQIQAAQRELWAALEEWGE